MEAKKYNAVKKLITYANSGIDDEYVEKINDKEVLKIKFQTGGTATIKKNGIFIEDLLIVAYAKLKEFNDQLPCRENSIALIKIEESILWLTKRKLERQSRGVYGTENR